MKILKGFLLFIGGSVSILFIIGMIVGEQGVESSSAEFVVEDQAAEEEYVETVMEKSLREKRELVGRAYQVKDILNEEFRADGYFDYDVDLNAFFMTITNQEMIDMAKTVSDDEDKYGSSSLSDVWDTNITDTMVELSRTISEKMEAPTSIAIKTPWEHDPDGVWSILTAEDGILLTRFGK